MIRYINAETAGGGYPGWLSNAQDTARSNGSDFTAAWKPYIQAVSKYTAPYQYPDGPVILIQSENEYSMDNPSVSIENLRVSSPNSSFRMRRRMATPII